MSRLRADTMPAVTVTPRVSTMKPEPSELVLRGCRSPPLSPPLELPPGPPRRFLKKSSKNSSNGEPGGSCGIAPLPSAPPLASTVCEVEMLTTASITFSATSAMPSGPRAKAGPDNTGAETTVAAPRQIAANQGRRRWLRAGIALIMFDLSLQKTGRNLKSTVRPNGAAAQASEPHPGRKNRLYPDRSWPCEYGEKPALSLTMTLIPQHFFAAHVRGRHSGVVRQHQSSDVR